MPHVDLSTVNVDELFRIIDADGSGNISFMEFMKWYKGHHKATGKAAGTMFAEAKRIFGELDDDDSGSLEKPEIAELLRRLTGGAGHSARTPTPPPEPELQLRAKPSKPLARPAAPVRSPAACP